MSSGVINLPKTAYTQKTQKIISDYDIKFLLFVWWQVHERDQDSDFCLLVVRKLLRTNSRHVKVMWISEMIQSNSVNQTILFKASAITTPIQVGWLCFTLGRRVVVH